jgi:uncharacterized protein YdeI (YjbR/CyaY-like superfamily)
MHYPVMPLYSREAFVFMEVRETLKLNTPEEFRQWLQDNHQTKIEIWLIFHKKSSGRQTLTIAQAVEEALCFGWIQSRLKPLDPETFAVRFSPRHKGSIWSLPNLKRVRKLIAQGRMTEAGLAVLPEYFQE